MTSFKFIFTFAAEKKKKTMRRIKKQYENPEVNILRFEVESALLTGSIVTPEYMNTIEAASQEVGQDIDMSESGFNHTWE